MNLISFVDQKFCTKFYTILLSLYKNLHNFTFCVKRWHGVSIRERYERRK